MSKSEPRFCEKCGVFLFPFEGGGLCYVRAGLTLRVPKKETRAKRKTQGACVNTEQSLLYRCVKGELLLTESTKFE